MEQELRDFLRGIGCQDTIKKMEEEKLDLTVISYMSVDDLVKILPKLGDRIALKLFVDEEIKKKQESQYQGKERKTKLIQSLCAKLGIVKTRHCHDTTPAEFQDKCISESSLKWRKRTMAIHYNRNAFKENRKVEFGWIHNGKQVRTAKGGGTHKIELPRNSRKQEILDKAKTLFFPTNHAPLGSIVDFIFKLTDFSNREIQNETIEELYESSKVSLLRLYMVTEKKDSLSKESLTVQDQIMILSEPLAEENTISAPETLHDGLESYHKPPVTFLNRKTKESNCEEAKSIQIACPLDIAVPVHLWI